MKQNNLKKGKSFRKLSDSEASEENIYKHQMKERWGFEPGTDPREIYRKEQEAKANKED